MLRWVARVASVPCAVAVLLLVAQPVTAKAESAKPSEEGGKTPRIADKVAGLAARPGLLTTWLDAEHGKLWAELPTPGADGVVGEYLYVESIRTGLGSNPVGLDRGQLGPAQIVRLRRIGPRVLVEVPNQRFRALSEDPAERQAVAESFATSVLWGGEVAALEPDGRSLVDLTPFVVRDAHGAARTMEQAGQGSWELDASRSALDVEGCRAFPENLELQAILTFGGNKPGAEVRSVAPLARSVTLVSHQSLIAVPAAGYRPRRFDPRAGSFGITFADYAAPLGQPIETRWLVRHRRQSGGAPGQAVKPIVFYVDRAAPEPIRSALLEGAGWWAEAFAKAGFPGGYRAELLPEGVDPLDVRYNVVQWVHRSTRGWSYGGGVIDPRSGEMVKGHVTLGSLRVRQDILIFEGLLGTAKTGTGAPDDPVQLALARIRQLAAHEVGHALGLAHNFAASTYGGRASVMDYPAPLVTLAPDGTVEVSKAYTKGVGAWDVQAIRFAYAEAPPEANEGAMLETMVADGDRAGLRFITDEDARPAGAAQPYASLWDNGADPAAELEQVLAVRKAALARFGAPNIAAGRPLAQLQEVLAPIYLWHRYQVDATVKSIGGLEYSYAVRPAQGEPARSRFVDPEEQRRALAVLLSAMRPSALDLPEPLLQLLLPRPSGFDPNREMFSGQEGLLFDPLAAAATAADLVISGLTQPERLARVADFHRRDTTQPSLEEVLGALVDAAFPAKPETSARLAEIGRVVQRVTVDHLVTLASSEDTAYPAKVRAEAELRDLVRKLQAPAADRTEAAHRALLRHDLQRYLEQREWQPQQLVRALEPPPGMPIGTLDGLDE